MKFQPYEDTRSGSQIKQSTFGPSCRWSIVLDERRHDRSRLQSDSELKDLAYIDGAGEFLVGGRALNQVTSLFDLLNPFRDTILLPTSLGASPGKVAKDETHPAVVIRWNIVAGRPFGSAQQA